MIYVENKDLVIPMKYWQMTNTTQEEVPLKENGKICSSLMGLVSLRNKKLELFLLKVNMFLKRRCSYW